MTNSRCDNSAITLYKESGHCCSTITLHCIAYKQSHGLFFRAKGLDVPGIKLDNIKMLETPEDARQIHTACLGCNVVLVGTSFVGTVSEKYYYYIIYWLVTFLTRLITFCYFMSDLGLYADFQLNILPFWYSVLQQHHHFSFSGMEIASYLIDKSSSITVVGSSELPYQNTLGREIGKVTMMVRKKERVLYYILTLLIYSVEFLVV